MFGIAIGDRLFGSAPSHSHLSEIHESKDEPEQLASSAKTTLEEPQSSGTKAFNESGLIRTDTSYDLEQKRKDSIDSSEDNVDLEQKREDSIVSDGTDIPEYSFWISRDEEEHLAQRVGDAIWHIASLENPQQRSMDEDEAKVFEGEIVPSIPLSDYLCRLCTYINRLIPNGPNDWGVSPGMRSVILALVYIDRLVNKPDAIKVNRYNVHRICMAAVFVAAKYQEDEALPRKFLANVAGVSMKQLAQIETTFCCKMEFDFWVTKEEFVQTYCMLTHR